MTEQSRPSVRCCCTDPVAHQGPNWSDNLGREIKNSQQSNSSKRRRHHRLHSMWTQFTLRRCHICPQRQRPIVTDSDTSPVSCGVLGRELLSASGCLPQNSVFLCFSSCLYFCPSKLLPARAINWFLSMSPTLTLDPGASPSILSVSEVQLVPHGKQPSPCSNPNLKNISGASRAGCSEMKMKRMWVRESNNTTLDSVDRWILNVPEAPSSICKYQSLTDGLFWLYFYLQWRRHLVSLPWNLL